MSKPVNGWGMPPFPRTLADGDPLLTPTDSILSPEREQLRQQIVDSHLAGTSPVTDRKPIMYLMGGGGASGKGAVKKGLIARGEIATANVVNLDPDEIKESFPEYGQIIAAGDSRAAATVHEESSAVSKRVLGAAMEGRRDIAYDVTMGNPSKGNALIDRAKDAGYEVRLYGVTVDPATAVHRNADRAGRTGRYVPVNSQLEAHKGFSEGFEGYAARADRAELFDTNSGRERSIAGKRPGGELVVIQPEEYAAFRKKAELDPEASGPEELYPQVDEQRLFSRGGTRTNQEIVDGGEGLPRTRETVDEAAAAGGVDLRGVDVVLVEEPDEIRYLDYQQAYACTPTELGGDQIRLGPASFADRETLVATLAHEKTHVEQLRAGAELNSETIKDLEAEAYASEAAALERLREHDNNQVHGGDHVRPAEPGRDPGTGDAGDRGDPGRDDVGDGGDELAGADSGRGVPDAGERGDEQGDVEDRAGGRDGDRAGDDADQPGLKEAESESRGTETDDVLNETEHQQESDSEGTETDDVLDETERQQESEVDGTETEEQAGLEEDTTLESESTSEPGADDGLEDESGTEADATAQVETDAQNESEQQVAADAQAEADAEAEAEQESAREETEAQAEQEAGREGEAESQQDAEVEAQREADEQAEADDAQVDNESQQQTEREETEAEAGSEAEQESTRTETETESEEQVAREDEAGAETETAGADAQAHEPGQETQADPGAESGAETETEADAGADPGAESEVESGADAEAEAQAGADTNAEAETGADAQAEAETGADAQVEAETEAEAGAEAASESEAEGAGAEAGEQAGAEAEGAGGYEDQAAADDARVAGAMESEEGGGDYEGGDYSYEDNSAGDEMGRE